MKKVNIIGDYEKLSEYKKRNIKKIFTKLTDNEFILKTIDIRVDGIIFGISYNNMDIQIEDDILYEVFFSPTHYCNPTPQALIMYMRIKTNPNITKEELFKDVKFKGEFAFVERRLTVENLSRVTKVDNGWKIKTYDEYYNDFRREGKYKAKKTYLKPNEYVEINSPTIKSEYYVYRFLDEKNNILYVGKTVDLDKRMNVHFGNNGHLSEDEYAKVKKVEYIRCDNQAEMSVKEIYFINRYKPPFNTSMLWDGNVFIEEYDEIKWENTYEIKEEW